MSRRTALFALSLSTITDEQQAGHVALLPADMRAEVERQQAEERANATKAAAAEVIAIMKDVDTSNGRDRTAIRQYRESIKHIKGNMDRRDRALAYGLKTGNHVPLLVEMGLGYEYRGTMTASEFEKLKTIPDDFDPNAD